MTYATDKGLVIGRKYRVTSTQGYDRNQSYPVGAILTFTLDDESRIPWFEDEEGKEVCWYVDHLAPVDDKSETVTFDTEEVKTEVTVVRFNRKLTQAEQDAIMAIFNKGE